MTYDPVNLALVGLAFALGGVLKGATGAGAPLVAVPLIAMLYDVPFAVAVFAIPNLVSNAWQAWSFRASQTQPRFALAFAGAGALGAIAGTLILKQASSERLLLVVAGSVLAYVGFRLARPAWTLPMRVARWWVAPVGAFAGLLQAAAGLSAPISLTFLNALRLDRAVFIATVSTFFLGVGATQLPALAWLGLMTRERALLGVVALVPIFALMPLGAWAARRLARETFDRVILTLLVILAAKLLWDGLA